MICMGNENDMSVFFFISLKLMEETLKYTLYKLIQTTLAYIISFFFAKVSDYRAVGLSRHRTIDTHPNEWITVFFFIVHAVMERCEFINGKIK